ncbi:hypothetical protein LEP1GSC036_3157 [Leptospira weilii str. 2006001853]|uniref:Uncharacterized protein n=2 Tax=Leptospira weilii TaxID=28184 RepID=A0A828YZG5_9LEPT|nr:hypothetical protein LEP1GSC036_3157 [Leptospira weilii str. 2006001853]EMN90940.1 hypothetical protein LEP1GSC108_4331 [Leptospira weilii str. UI 13098]
MGTKFHRFIFGSKYLWGKVLLESNTLVSYSPKLSIAELTLK